MKKVLLAGIFTLIGSGGALAHHSFTTEYDGNKTFNVKGTVSKVEWTNPHARLYIDVKDDRGPAANWNVEMASPNILVRNGWKQNTVRIGDEITVTGYLARKGERMAIAATVADANGKPLFASNPTDIGR